MTAPKEVKRLVERFRENRDAYLSSAYNETQLRREFLDPFFKALGWDVDNEQGYAEAYKDVVHEDAIKVGGATKAPDYAFRIGGTRKFFVEAKRPSVGIKDDPDAAYQLRRYAWSAKLPLSILTDFEEFAVYDCRVRPNKDDKASTARTLYFTYDEYEAKWDEIAGIFARDAILKGSFDRYVEAKRKRGTAEVDDAFLKEIEGWRDVLARNIALRNTGLSNREVNFAVQRTIDQIIFLRICEDRGIEAYGQLMALRNGHDVYRRLCEVFRNADDRYNSGLFHFRKEKGRGEAPDELTLGLRIDDKVLKDVFKDLYYPDSPYEFSVLPADILGHIYEQFLGKVIRLTPAHRAVVEEKPEVRKAGGVYYTPTYIVAYIVEHTVGKLLEGKKPNQVAKLRVLDPACGSGSFLLGAYQRLLDWHLAWYAENDPAKHAKGRKPKIFQGAGGDWRLTTAEKKRILLNNIYGVDIDPQAVNVTKLSLLLKVLEGESGETLGKTLRMFHERALPDLGENIKCGNSLIGPDFYEGKQLSLIDEEERYRINAFDWHAEFPEIMKAGGFDTVIGNPPYLRIQGLREFHESEIPYLAGAYESAVKRFDLYMVFAERGFRLLRPGGVLGYICPHKFANADSGSGFRAFLVSSAALARFISFGDSPIFSNASTYTGLLFLTKRDNKSFRYVELSGDIPADLSRASDSCYTSYEFSSLSAAPWLLLNKPSQGLLTKLESRGVPLGEVMQHILVGVQSGIDAIHVVAAPSERAGDLVSVFSERAGEQVLLERDLIRPLLTGEDVQRFGTLTWSHYCIYPYKLLDGSTVILEEEELRTRFPHGFEYLQRFRQELRETRVRQRTNPKYWYSCHRSRDMSVFETRRVITPEISHGCNMAICPGGIYHNTQVYSLLPGADVPEPLEYWLGILNSRVLWWFLSRTGAVLRGGYYRFKTNYLAPFPVPQHIPSHDSSAGVRDTLVAAVRHAQELRQLAGAAKTNHELQLSGRQINATDRQIDQLVYELYGLTDKEIRIVEEATR